MNRTPLIATPTVDKNGRLTTVHRKADAGGAKTSALLPKVSLPADPQDQCKRIVESAFHTDVDSVKMSPNVREKMMATLHENTLPLMTGVSRDYGIDMHTFRKATDWSAQSRHFAILNGFVKLLSESEDKTRDQQLYFLYAMRGVQYARPGKAQIDITDPDDLNAEGGQALVNAFFKNLETGLVKATQTTKDHTAFTFLDHELGSLIIERPDRADDIVDLYRKHGRYDRGLFEAALDHDVRVLNDGVL